MFYQIRENTLLCTIKTQVVIQGSFIDRDIRYENIKKYLIQFAYDFKRIEKISLCEK